MLDRYYKVLELKPNADPEEVKKAYFRLAHKYHPDTSTVPDEIIKNTKRFQEISEAYLRLTDNQQATNQQPDEMKTTNEAQKFSSFVRQFAAEDPVFAKVNRGSALRTKIIESINTLTDTSNTPQVERLLNSFLDEFTILQYECIFLREEIADKLASIPDSDKEQKKIVEKNLYYIGTELNELSNWLSILQPLYLELALTLMVRIDEKNPGSYFVLSLLDDKHNIISNFLQTKYITYKDVSSLVLTLTNPDAIQKIKDWDFFHGLNFVYFPTEFTTDNHSQTNSKAKLSFKQFLVERLQMRAAKELNRRLQAKEMTFLEAVNALYTIMDADHNPSDKKYHFLLNNLYIGAHQSQATVDIDMDKTVEGNYYSIIKNAFDVLTKTQKGANDVEITSLNVLAAAFIGLGDHTSQYKESLTNFVRTLNSEIEILQKNHQKNSFLFFGYLTDPPLVKKYKNLIKDINRKFPECVLAAKAQQMLWMIKPAKLACKKI